MKIVVICLSLAMYGCAAIPPAPRHWYKSGASEETQMRDKMFCRQYGMQSATANGLTGNMFVESWIQREADSCMSGLGYM
jgi:hypothetical protein